VCLEEGVRNVYEQKALRLAKVENFARLFGVVIEEGDSAPTPY
jgi:hypothetical protein